MSEPRKASTASLRLRFTGDAAKLSAADRDALFSRVAEGSAHVAQDTAAIIADVRARGDAALFDMAKKFDGAELAQLEVPRRSWKTALDKLDPGVRRAMDRAAANIAAVHRQFLPVCVEVEPEPGITIGRRPDPLARVGVYAPGGRASYPSSVLMAAVPARVAGVREVILASPPGRSGELSQPVLAAAELANVDRVFAVGGAGAVGAMAFGTESIPRVDRIVGPGNAYVAAAKLQVVGQVAIDSPAGPSELVVIADDTSDPALVAGELVAQAEHDPLACVIAIVASDSVAGAIEQELAIQSANAVRAGIVRDALAGQGGVLRVPDLDAAVTFSNAYAPEHLLLAVDRAEEVLPAVRNAGTVFVGSCASVAFGDYMTGANHVLPTGGLARAYSGLSSLDFIRWTTYQRVDAAAAQRLSNDVGVFADAEQLPGHAAAARRWGTR